MTATPAPASAQTTAIPTGTASRAKPAVAEEVVVTARRRSEAVSKTPMAITAISGTQLVAQGVVTANQLQYLAPSLTVSQGRQGVELTIRGVTTTDTSTKGEPDIAFNIDGVPTLRSEEQALALFDLQRVEVLNGPQSTLYGVASTGGDINVITNAPSFTRAASATAEIANYNTQRVQAMVNAPINDMFAVRVAVSDNQRDGFISLRGANNYDKPGDEDNFTGRIGLLGKITNDLTIRLTNTGGKLGGVGYPNAVPIAVTGSDGELTGHASPYGYGQQYTGHVDDYYDMTTLQIDDAFGPVHLALLSSYNFYHEKSQDPDYFPGIPLSADPFAGGAINGSRIIVHEKYQTYFDELRATNQDPGDRVQYVAGVNFLRQLNNEDGHGFQIDPNAPAPVLPYYSTLFEPLNITTQTSYSVFLHTVTAITPQLRLTLGGRESFDRDDRQGSFAIGTGFGAPWNNIYGTPCIGLQACVGVPDSGSEHSNAFTFNTGLDYRITPHQLVYVSASRGYKPGGFNDPSPALGNTTAPYGPEKLYAYEVGYKLSLPSGIRVSSNFFYYDFKQQQITEFAQFAGLPSTLFTLLKPTSEYGSENAVSYPITPDDLLDATADFLHGTYSAGNGALTGQSLSNMPVAVVSGAYTHFWRLGSGAQIKLYGKVRWSASYKEDDIANTTQIRQPGFTRSDASLSYVSPSGRYTTQAFVTNIENKVQFTSALEEYPGQTDSVAGQITTPRFFGVRESVNF